MNDQQAMTAKSRTIKRRKDMPEVAGASFGAEDTALSNLRDRTWGVAEEWAARGWPWMERVLKGAVAMSKGEK